MQVHHKHVGSCSPSREDRVERKGKLMRVCMDAKCWLSTYAFILRQKALKNLKRREICGFFSFLVLFLGSSSAVGYAFTSLLRGVFPTLCDQDVWGAARLT